MADDETMRPQMPGAWRKKLAAQALKQQTPGRPQAAVVRPAAPLKAGSLCKVRAALPVTGGGGAVALALRNGSRLCQRV